MLFMFTAAQARYLGAVADAASSDYQGRPAIAQVQFNYEVDNKAKEVTITAVATDSYVLARRIIRLDDLHYVWEDEQPKSRELGPTGQVLLPAKEFKAAMKQAASAVRVIGEVAITISPDRKDVTIEADTFSQKLRNNLYDYPNWKKLLPEDGFIYEGDIKLGAFNPKKLAQICSIISTQPSERETYPVRLGVSSTNGSELKPWGFELKNSNHDLTVLLMPVRI